MKCWIICQNQAKLFICAMMAHMMIVAFNLRPKTRRSPKGRERADWINLDMTNF